MSTNRAVRQDGLLMNYDPTDPAMIAKYGAPGQTDHEGFDPHSDSVGAGIYGGRVQRDGSGNIVIGKQYQNHNRNPGPVYAGGGYTPTSNALRFGQSALKPLFDTYPELANEITTGGATPLHMCGMGRDNQNSTAYVIARGGEVDAVDSYGMRPLHRMASNNLAVGALALLEAGADVDARAEGRESALQMALAAGAGDVVKVIKAWKARS